MTLIYVDGYDRNRDGSVEEFDYAACIVGDDYRNDLIELGYKGAELDMPISALGLFHFDTFEQVVGDHGDYVITGYQGARFGGIWIALTAFNKQ